MPSARKKGKTISTLWLDRHDKALLDSLTETFGLSKSDVFKIAIRMLKNDKSLDEVVEEVRNETWRNNK